MEQKPVAQSMRRRFLWEQVPRIQNIQYPGVYDTDAKMELSL